MPAKPSKIGYCDYSGGDLNFCLGCTAVSAGCANCYARRIYDRFGKDFSKVELYPDKLERLLKWQPKAPYKRGSRPLAFVVDMGDLFHEQVPDEFISDSFRLMIERDDIDWLVLTKRAKRMCQLINFWRAICTYPLYNFPPNLWLGVTVEDEDNLWRIDELLKTPAAVRWVSLEPMLGPMDLSPWFLRCDCGARPYEGPRTWRHIGPERHHSHPYPVGHVKAMPDPLIDWIVVGAESGPNRRPFKKEWAWDVLDQCREANVPCFLKQDSGLRPGVPLLDREGREVKEWPKT